MFWPRSSCWSRRRIVSRQIDPQQPAVLTVGTIHGGTKNNIIPDEVTMGLTLRTYSVEVRDQIIAAVKRDSEWACRWLRHSRRPHAHRDAGREHDPTINDAALNERMRKRLWQRWATTAFWRRTRSWAAKMWACSRSTAKFLA